MLTADLYPYQSEAVDMCLDLGYGLIAYEMGLGKTICGIALVEELLTTPDINFALLIVPSGLRYQWAESIAKFTDVTTKQKKIKGQSITIPKDEWCVVVDGSPAKRKEQYRYIKKNWPNYVIISYEQAVNDYAQVKSLGAEAIILDEATAIKGFKAQRSKQVKALGRRADFTFALTGTPMENRPEEVYSIMEFVEPRILGPFTTFDLKYIVRNAFGSVERYRNLDILFRKLSKVMSRKTRLDPDVAPYMPLVQNHDEFVFITGKTKALYTKVAKMLKAELADMQVTGSFDIHAYYTGEGGEDMTQQGKIMAKLLFLQMLCDDPRLVELSAQKYDESGGEAGSAFAAEVAEEGFLEDLEPSAKLKAVVEDVNTILEQNPKNKIIIFSFFKDMGYFLAEALEPYESVIYNGNMSAAAKAAARAQFQQDPDCRLFIASDAGAFGVDLPEANYLINYDLVDSAGKMDQRNARHVRAGSEHKKVYVSNYIVDGSIEERRLARLNFKRKVSRAVVDGYGADRDGVIENDVATLTDFLEYNTEEEAS